MHVQKNAATATIGCSQQVSDLYIQFSEAAKRGNFYHCEKIMEKINIENNTIEVKVGGKNIAWKCQELNDGLVYLKSTALKPAWPHILLNGKERALAEDLFPVNFPATLVEPETVSIEATDGFTSFGQLLKPANYQKGKKYPAIIFLHGGSRRQI